MHFRQNATQPKTKKTLLSLRMCVLHLTVTTNLTKSTLVCEKKQHRWRYVHWRYVSAFEVAFLNFILITSNYGTCLTCFTWYATWFCYFQAMFTCCCYKREKCQCGAILMSTLLTQHYLRNVCLTRVMRGHLL